jgi:gp16 family phage-associated protein
MAAMELKKTLIDQAKMTFYLQGLSIADWAREHDFHQDTVYAVLSGRSKGLRGESHRIAVKLGLKPNIHQIAEKEATKQ